MAVNYLIMNVLNYVKIFGHVGKSSYLCIKKKGKMLNINLKINKLWKQTNKKYLPSPVYMMVRSM